MLSTKTKPLTIQHQLHMQSGFPVNK